MKKKMIPRAPHVHGTDPKTDFERFDALARFLITAPQPKAFEKQATTKRTPRKR